MSVLKILLTVLVGLWLGQAVGLGQVAALRHGYNGRELWRWPVDSLGATDRPAKLHLGNPFINELHGRNWQLGSDDQRAELAIPLSYSGQTQRLAATVMLLGAANWLVYHQFNQAWWVEERSRFHLYKGYRRTVGFYDMSPADSYYYHLDKAGHFYSAIFLSESFFAIGKWIGYSDTGARWLAAGLASLLMLEIEIYDGYFKEWGFSVGDFIANEMGVWWALRLQHLPPLQGIRFKMSYDSSLPLEDEYWIKNYSAMTFWASLPVPRWLPAPLKHVWPSWLNLAFGYSTDRLRHGHLQSYLALDISPDILPKSKSPLLLLPRLLLTYVHLPLPAVQLSPSPRFRPTQY